jgi:hypothetical protein
VNVCAEIKKYGVKEEKNTFHGRPRSKVGGSSRGVAWAHPCARSL